jgi:DNA-binding NarL/FixJ family response regulator
VRVLLAEDLSLMRHGIRSVLPPQDVEIVAEADNVEEAVRLAAEVSPDVVLIDQDLPQGDVLEAIRTIQALPRGVRVIVMTDELDDVKAVDAIEAGACGYILKDIPGTNLAAAIRATCNGRASLHPTLTRALMDRLSQLARLRGWDRAKGSGLTARELDILAEVARGRTDEEIAKRFVVTAGTIKTHIRHILRKLSARNRAQAVAHVLRRGLIK